MTDKHKENILRRIFNFMTLLNIEPYLLLYTFVGSVKTVPLNQLIQDKICLFEYKLSANYCSQLPTMTADDDYLGYKAAILKELNTFTLYSFVILTIPSVLATMFVGAWTDKYLGAKRVLLIAGAFAGVCEAVVLILNVYFFEISKFTILLAYVPFVLSGGMLAVFTSMYAYIASSTPPKLLAIRLTVCEILNNIAIPLATWSGGKLLNTRPILTASGQLNNYGVVFMVSGGAFALSLIWSVIFVNEEKDIKKFDKRFNSCEQTDSECNDKHNDSDDNTVCERLKQFNEYKHIHPIRLLFSLDNIRSMVKTCVKRRPNRLRAKIWALFSAQSVILLSAVGPALNMFPFAQIVYVWNSETYSNVMTLDKVVTTLATFIIVPILIKALKIRDTTLAMIGLVSFFAQNLIRGLILTPVGFFLSMPTGSLGTLAGIGIRSLMAKIVPAPELGKVFSLMSVLDSCMPLIAVTLFTAVFNATMESMPGLTFLITASLQTIPFLIMIWMRMHTVVPGHSAGADNESTDTHIVVDATDKESIEC